MSTRGTAPSGTVTGVAGGSLGTAANLEDTQVYELDDLQLPEPAIATRPDIAPEPIVARQPDLPPAPEIPPQRVAFDAPVSPVASLRPARSRPIVGGGTVAAALVAVIGGAVLLSFANNGGPGVDLDAGANAPNAPTAGATFAPATQPPDDGKGKGNGNGKGKPH